MTVRKAVFPPRGSALGSCPPRQARDRGPLRRRLRARVLPAGP